MSSQGSWQDELKYIAGMMRELSRESDPQTASQLYGQRLREWGLVPADGYIGLSRRGLAAPHYRMTRSSTWKEAVNPWQQPNKLPMFDSGLLGELIYSNEPAVIRDLPSRLRRDDPCYEFLKDMELLVASPHYDDGEALNMGVTLVRHEAGFPYERIPTLVWQSILWGRAVRNLVLQKELAAAYKSLDYELRTVGQIQQTLLPNPLPNIPGLDVAAYYQTAQRAGGDYYDFFFPCEGGRCGIFIADVSGHGPPAAVIMAVTHAIAHLDPGRGTPPGQMLAFINRHLTDRYLGGSGSFVTGLYAIFDPARRTLTYSRAGHNPARLLRDGKCLAMDHVGGLPLGIMDNGAYAEHTEALRGGDLLMFYTDGITESKNGSGGMFDVEGLDAALGAGPPEAQASIDRVLASVSSFTGGAPPLDDRTLLAMGIR